MAALNYRPGADNSDFQFTLPRCHFEVLLSDSLDASSFKTKKFRSRLRFSESGANEYLPLFKIIFRHDHGGRRTNPLHALFPSLQSVEYLNLYPQIVNGNLERIDQRESNGVFLGGDDRADVSANASLQELGQFLFCIAMVIRKVTRQLDVGSQSLEALLEAFRRGNAAQRPDIKLFKIIER